MFAEVLALDFESFVVEEGLVVFEVVTDDGVDVVCKYLPDLVFLGIDFVFYVFDAEFSGLCAFLDQFLDVGYQLVEFVTHSEIQFIYH